MRALYKYPQAEYPYLRLIEENRKRDRYQREFELEVLLLSQLLVEAHPTLVPTYR
jgi:hypothetical protein